MNVTQGLLADVLPFSYVDGPGNRSVVFLQGCNLACVYCHNPSTIGLCTHCGDCVEPCPEDALSFVHGKVTVDWELCTRCRICIDVCPESSTPLAETVTSAELLDRLRPSAAFVSGVTVSGGEATFQPDFLVDFATAFKADVTFAGKDLLIDSNGVTPLDVWDRLAPSIDGVMLDLKAFSPTSHLELTGGSNEPVLASAVHLAELELLTEVRVVLVPGCNDSPDELDAMAAWLAPLGVPVKLIGVNHHGVVDPTFDEAGPDDVLAASTIFASRGIEVVLAPTGHAIA